MTLIVSECMPSAYQFITPTSPVFVYAIRPHLYIHGSPAGTVTVQIQDDMGRVVQEATPLTITTLKTLAYAHGYFRFLMSANLAQDATYRIAVVCGGGYSFSESAYVGVCHDWDNTKATLSYTANGSFEKPLDIEIWEKLP